MKNKIIKLLSFFCLFIFLLNFYCTFADDIEIETDNTTSVETSSSDLNELDINARSCIILDRVSKKILYGKNENNKVKMASTTKIMTATIIIENCDLSKTVEVSKKAAGTGGSRLGLKTGDKITIRDLLYGLMLCSGNDAAVALAEECSGSTSDFSILMNEKAKNLGLINSHFESPHGLDSDEHYTTCYELALLSDYALNNKIFFDIVGTKNYTVTINGSPKNISNTNELLGNLNGVYGIKTGFTNGANRCLVTACKRDDMDIICVVLGCDTKKFRTKDSIRLIEYTFKKYEYVNIKEKIDNEFENWKQNNISNLHINKGVSQKIDLIYSDLNTPIIPIDKENISCIKIIIDLNEKNQHLDAPLYQNTVIGRINVFENDKNLLSLDILVSNNIPKKSFTNYIFEFLKNYSSIMNSISNII